MLKASLLYPMVNAKTSTEKNYDGRRKTKNGAKTNAAGWLRRGLSRRSLFPEGRTYSPPPKCAAFWRWWYPSPKSGRALCEADAGCCVPCEERRTMRASLLSSAQLSVLSWTAHPGIAGTLRHFPPPDTCFCKTCHWQVLQRERIATAPSEPRNDEYERKRNLRKEA